MKSRIVRNMVLFDPSNDSHMEDYARFLKYSNWTKGCAYLLEDPFLDIPTMIRSKVVEYTMRYYTDRV